MIRIGILEDFTKTKRTRNSIKKINLNDQEHTWGLCKQPIYTKCQHIISMRNLNLILHPDYYSYWLLTMIIYIYTECLMSMDNHKIDTWFCSFQCNNALPLVCLHLLHPSHILQQKIHSTKLSCPDKDSVILLNNFSIYGNNENILLLFSINPKQLSIRRIGSMF